MISSPEASATVLFTTEELQWVSRSDYHVSYNWDEAWEDAFLVRSVLNEKIRNILDRLILGPEGRPSLGYLRVASSWLTEGF